MGIKKVGLITAISIVIANIIGTGVFTSIGFQAVHIQSVFPLLALWAVGGIFALFGALSYGEIASELPESGGEYYYLSRIYHPAVGFLGGWVSLFVGFSAPVALAAMAFGRYFHGVTDFLSPSGLAAIIVVLVTSVHAFKVEAGSKFQVFFTFLKFLLIIVFIAAGFFIPEKQPISVAPVAGDLSLIFSPFFAISLIYVSYSYSGWNAATYIASEIINPQKNVPKSLFIGTFAVMGLYVLLNYIFLLSTPITDFIETTPGGELTGKVEVGLITAKNIFGETGGGIMGIMISALLISTISAMIFVGPRVIQAMSKDFKALSYFSNLSRYNVPVRAIIFQSLITLVFIYTSTFEEAINYAGFTLNLFTLLTVAGLFVLRAKNKRRNKKPQGYRAWGYPVTPIIFILLNLWILVFLLIDKTTESIFGLATIAAGLIFYFITKDK